MHSMNASTMAVKRITERAVSRLQTGETVWDETVRGFGVRRQRHAVVYVFKYRLNGKQRFMTIGRHGSPWTADEARTEAKWNLYALIDKVRQRDPAAERDVTKSEPTFAQFAATYLTDYAAIRKKPRSLSFSDFSLSNISRSQCCGRSMRASLE